MDIEQHIADLERLRKEAGQDVYDWGAMPFGYQTGTGWIDGEDDDWFVYRQEKGKALYEGNGGNVSGPNVDMADALYIAALHNIVPVLIAEIRRLRVAQ